ncbi:MAG: hypothetical protein ABIZ91_12500 [Gemmatimonadaceae bacterium]
MRGIQIPAVAVLVGAISAPGQSQQRVESPLARPQSAAAAPTAADSGSASGWAVLASAVVPGAGQLALGQKRGFAYLALEVYAWAGYGSQASNARNTRRGYRSLARSVARAALSPNGPAGDFDYYERMEHYLSSGAFDRGSGALLEPESDESTFNGAMWLLARRTFWANPALSPPRGSVEWQQAEAFYLRRAIRPEFRWSWQDAPQAHDQFRQLIRRSNESERRAMSHLGVALGNHVLSTIDAYVSIRLRQREDLGPQGYEVSVALPLPRRH